MLRVAIIHAAHLPERQASFDRLMKSLQPLPDYVELEVFKEKEPCWNWARKAWTWCAGGDHGLVLQDDAVVCDDFWSRLSEYLLVYSNRVMGLFTSCKEAPDAYAAGHRAAEACGALIGISYAGPGDFFKEAVPYLEKDRWENIMHDKGEDTILQWVLADNDQSVLLPLPSLVSHDTALKSTWDNPHAGTDTVRASCWMADVPRLEYERAPETLVRFKSQFAKMHLFRLLVEKTPSLEAIQGAYKVVRNGAPVADKTTLMIATPSYQAPLLQFLKSRDEVSQDLVTRDIDTVLFMTPGDSLVMRGRQRIVHQFLKTNCTHLLFWDNDIESCDAGVVWQMLDCNKPVVGGAIPFRNPSGSVVGNLFQEDLESGRVSIDKGAVRARDVGTGFMLVKREVIERVMADHPELRHVSGSTDDMGEPLWSIFDTDVEHERAAYERMLLSEDYLFCRLARESGFESYLFAAGKFRHWGLFGFEGSLENKYNLKLLQEEETPKSTLASMTPEEAYKHAMQSVDGLFRSEGNEAAQ